MKIFSQLNFLEWIIMLFIWTPMTTLILGALFFDSGAIAIITTLTICLLFYLIHVKKHFVTKIKNLNAFTKISCLIFVAIFTSALTATFFDSAIFSSLIAIIYSMIFFGSVGKKFKFFWGILGIYLIVCVWAGLFIKHLA